MTKKTQWGGSREGSGRPPKPPQEKGALLKSYPPAWLYKLVRAKSDSTGQSLSEIVIEALRTYFQQEQEMKKPIWLSEKTLQLVDALADVFEHPETFDGEYSDESRDTAIACVFRKVLRQTGNEHILDEVDNPKS